LLRNDGGKFLEMALLSGVSHNGGGEVEAGMGVDFGDYDADGFADLIVSNFSFETYTLYRNLGDGFFTDVTATAGLARLTLLPLGFGIRFFDFDNDADLDIFCANGHVLHNINELEHSLTYAQTNQLLLNTGGRFLDVSEDLGPALKRPLVSRSAAFGDYDDDGDIDVLVSASNGPAELLRNDGGNNRHWLAVRTVGDESNRDGIGARVEVWVNGRRQVREVSSGGSYLAANDLRVHFGLGEATIAERLDVTWPSGLTDRWTALAADQLFEAREGSSPWQTKSH
jgi:hypothetical protein